MAVVTAPRERRSTAAGDSSPHATSEAAHEEVGRAAAESGAGQLFAVGKMAAATARGAKAGGLTRVMELPDADGAAQSVKKFLKPGDVVLLKASRAAKLERISEVLRMKC